jgi:hypothetical protein
LHVAQGDLERKDACKSQTDEGDHALYQGLVKSKMGPDHLLNGLRPRYDSPYQTHSFQLIYIVTDMMIKFGKGLEIIESDMGRV